VITDEGDGEDEQAESSRFGEDLRQRSSDRRGHGRKHVHMASFLDECRLAAKRRVASNSAKV
jgi:hypothetical protein